jgi:hypothetical protein
VSVREYHYLVDRDGRVSHDGSEIVDPVVLRFFLRAMQRTEDGRWLVVCQREHNWFQPHDTPFVVQRLGLTLEAGRLTAVALHFAGDYQEPLAPETLEADGGQVFCRLPRSGFRARLGRIALQQLAPHLADGPGGPALMLGDARYPVRGAVSGTPAAASTAR